VILDHKNGKIYALKILNTHKYRQLWFSEVFIEEHSLGDN
jgi:hypothetical protein